MGGTYRQMSRALGELQSEQVVVRAGYGVYLRPAVRDVEKGVEQVRQRLGKRVRRELVIAGISVQIGSPSRVPNKQEQQDQRKLVMAQRITEKFPVSLIRQRSLENIDRWQKQGAWVSAFEEWRELLTKGTDRQVLAVMTGEDEKANRLRQSAPYAGLLSQAEVEAI